MKIRDVSAGLMVAAFLLSGCSAPEPTASETTQAPSTASIAPTTVAPTQTPSPTPTRNENARGQLAKAIGEEAGLTDETGTATALTFKVTSIEPIQCDAPYGTQPTGTAMAVSLEIETTADFAGPLTVDGTPGQISFRPYYWKGYEEDGTRMNTVDTNISYNCLADRTRLVPDYIGKAEKVRGIVILDVSSETGSVAYSPRDDGGWIWQFPSA